MLRGKLAGITSVLPPRDSWGIKQRWSTCEQTPFITCWIVDFYFESVGVGSGALKSCKQGVPVLSLSHYTARSTRGLVRILWQ